MEIDEEKQNLSFKVIKFKEEFVARAASEGISQLLQNNCKVIKFTSDFNFKKILGFITKLKSKDYPNLFIFVIEIEKFGPQNKLPDYIETIKDLLAEYFKNRPIIIQVTSNGNGTTFFYKEENEHQYHEVKEQPQIKGNLQNLSAFLNCFTFGKIKNYENRMIETLPGVENSSLVLRFLRALNFSESFFHQLITKCAENGNKNEFLASLDASFGGKGRSLNLDAGNYLSETLNKENSPEVSILQMAIRNPNEDVINYLITHCTHLIQQLPFEHRIDISSSALNAGKFNVLCDLLEFSDFPFPRNLSNITIEDKRLMQIVEKRKKFHKAIENKNQNKMTKEIDEFIEKNSNLKIVFNINNQSALSTSIDSGNFQEYYRLKSYGFKAEITEKCEDIDTMTEKDKKLLYSHAWIQTKQNVKDSIANKNVPIFLSAKSLIHNRKISKVKETNYRKQIMKWFEELYKINICKEIMDAAAQCEDLKIIFDFESNSVENVDLKSKGASGTTYPKSKWIFIAAKIEDGNTEQYIKGVIIHEICHYVMRLVYENDENPYYENDKETCTLFEEIVKEHNKWTIDGLEDGIQDNSTDHSGTFGDPIEVDVESQISEKSEDKGEEEELEDDECDGIISSVYTHYNKEDYHPELIVRPPQILAQYNNDTVKSDYLKQKYGSMFDYYEKYVLPELRKFKLRNRESVRKFNKIVGLLPQIKRENYEFSASKISFHNLINNEPTVVTSNTPKLFLSDLRKNLAHENLSDTKNVFITPQSCENDAMLDSLKTIASENETIRVIVDCTQGIGKKFKDLLITKNVICIVSNEHHCTEIQKIFMASKKTAMKRETVTYTFGDLTEEMKLELLSTEVNFQNKSNISLLKLIANKNESEIATKSQLSPQVKMDKYVIDIVDEKLLNLLVEKSKVQINTKFECEKHFQILFRQRKFLKIQNNEYGQNTEEMSQEQLLEDVRNERNVLISDISGNGKSWALKNVATNLMEHYPDKWVSYIELKHFEDKLDFKRSNANFLKFMIENVLCSHNNFEMNIFKRMYKNGNVYILIDAFDEVSEECVNFTKELINSFKCNSGNQLWIATRDHFQAELQKILNINVVYKLVEFTEQDAAEVITHSWILHDLKKDSKYYSETELKSRVANYPRYQIYQNHARNLSKKILNSNFHQTGIPNICKLSAEIFNDKNDKSCIYDFNVEEIYNEYANSKYQEWTNRKECNTNAENENETFFSIHQYHAIKSMFPFLTPLCELVYKNVKWREEDIISCGLLKRKGNNLWFQHDSLKQYFAISFFAKVFQLAKTHVNKTYSDEVVAEYLRSFFHSSRFEIIRSFIDLLCNQSKELRDGKKELIEMLDSGYENKDFVEIGCHTVNKILAAPHENQNIALVTQLTNNLFGSNKIVKSVLGTLPVMKEFSREFNYFTENYIVKNEEAAHSSNATAIDTSTEFFISNPVLHFSSDIFKELFDIFMRSYSPVEATNTFKKSDKSKKNILYSCIEKKKVNKLRFIWENSENLFANSNSPADFKKIITQETLPFKYNAFHAAVVYNNDTEFHEIFWELVFKTFKDEKELTDILLTNDINGNNVVHLLLLYNNSDVIEFIFKQLKATLDNENYKKLLRSKNPNGNNLIQVNLIQKYKKSDLELLWKIFKGSCDTRNEYINIIMEVNDERSNVFQLAARFSTSVEILELIMDELESVAIQDEIKSFLSNQDILKRNFLQSAVKQNESPKCHEYFWKIIEKFFEPSEVQVIVKNLDSDGNNILHNVICNNTSEIAEITWRKIQQFLDEDDQIEYLKTRGHGRKTLRKLSLDNNSDCEIETWTENLYNSICHKHPHGSPEIAMKILSDGRITTRHEKLSKILNHPDVKDRNIVALSIIGRPKTGKSFFLNYCLRYLYAHYPSVNFPNNPTLNSIKWMEDDDEPLTGFAWGHDGKNVDNSIIIWNDVFLPPKKNDHEQIAIILMDTNESIENSSSHIESKMFNLTTLLASIQIFNLSSDLKENDAVFLKETIETGIKTFDTKLKEGEKPLQNLVLLIKDWKNKNEYYVQSGKDYLERNLLENSEGSKNLKHIDSSYEKLSCFRVSHPGESVASGKVKNSKYDGTWSEMDEDFKDELFEFIESLLEPENLAHKKVNGKKLNGEEFLTHIEQNIAKFQSSQPVEESMENEEMSEKDVNDIVEKYIDSYKQLMNQNLKSIQNENELKNLHIESRTQILTDFEKRENKGNILNYSRLKEIINEQTNLHLTEMEEQMRSNSNKVKEAVENKADLQEEATLRIKIQCNQGSGTRINGKPINILEFSSNGQVLIRNEELKKLLEHPDVKERKIVVVSIIGTHRKGKSFLLNYCLRFLYNHYPSIQNLNSFITNQNNWIGGENDALTGFLWGNDAVDDQSGIFLWNDAFYHSIQSTGEQLAIFVMDTHVSREDDLDCSKIFTFTSLMSSVQMLNVLNNLEEHHLESLGVGIESAVQTYEDTLCQKFKKRPFQKLLFLIRDWENVDEYSFDNGEEYLKKKLAVKDGQTKDENSARELIINSFEKLSCSLLPHPGKVVTTERKGCIKYDGSWSEMDDDFKDELSKLVENLLKPRNLVPKRINGMEVTGDEFSKYIEQIFKFYHSNTAAVDSEIRQSEDEIMSNIILLLTNDYKELMHQNLKTVKSITELDNIHKNTKIEIFFKYDETEKVTNYENKLKFKEILEKNMDKKYEDSKSNLDFVSKDIKNEISNIDLKIKKIQNDETLQFSLVENIQKELEILKSQKSELQLFKRIEAKLIFEKQRLLRIKAEKEFQKCLKDEFQSKINFEQLNMLSDIELFYST